MGRPASESSMHLKVARNVLRSEAEALNSVAELLSQAFHDAVELILNCKGKVVVTGVGKSGLVGRKIAATLASLGTPSIYIHPTEAYHGDLGVITPKDVCLTISNSGNTDEILRLVPSLKLLDIPIIAICSDARSELGREVEIVLETGSLKEACSLNLAPTTSTTVAMALGDALAVALVNAKGFTERDFAFFHPGGTLGRKLLTRVEDVLLPPSKVGRALASDDVRVLAEQMNISNLGMVVILNEKNKVLGVVTDGDLRRALQEPNFSSMTAQALMTVNPKSIQKNRLVTEAVRMAERYRITALLVTNNEGDFEGAVNLHDLIHEKVL